MEEINVCKQCKGINVIIKGQTLIRQLKQEEVREAMIWEGKKNFEGGNSKSC